jgi:hypothetical protein
VIQSRNQMVLETDQLDFDIFWQQKMLYLSREE